MNIADEFFSVEGDQDCVLHLQIGLPVLMSNQHYACTYRLVIDGEEISSHHIYGSGHLEAVLLTLSHVADLMNHWALGNDVKIASGVWDDLKKLCLLPDELPQTR